MIPRLIDVPVERETPLPVLAACRAIDPTAELLYIGEGRWWLGSVSTPNKYRQRTGLRLLKRELGRDHPDRGVCRQGTLLLQGFAMIAEYPEADDVLVEDFRRRDWQFKYEPDANEFTASESEPERKQEAARQRIREKLLADGKSIFRHFIRHDPVISLARGSR